MKPKAKTKARKLKVTCAACNIHKDATADPYMKKLQPNDALFMCGYLFGVAAVMGRTLCAKHTKLISSLTRRLSDSIALGLG